MSTPLTIEQITLVLEMFYIQADEDYLVARWASQSRLMRQFAWSAQQALEKYMKCALLLNGVNVKEKGHDLTKLFNAVRSMAGDLVPEILCLPHVMRSNMEQGYFEPLLDCIGRFNGNGSADNRYRCFGLVIKPFDLHKLDEMCFIFRRLCCVLNDTDLDGQVKNRAFLRQCPGFQHAMAPVSAKGFSELDTARLQSVFRDQNFSFCTDEAVAAKRVRTIDFSDVSPLQQLFVWTSDLDQCGADMSALKWLLDNAKISQEDGAALRELLTPPPTR